MTKLRGGGVFEVQDRCFLWVMTLDSRFKFLAVLHDRFGNVSHHVMYATIPSYQGKIRLGRAEHIGVAKHALCTQEVESYSNTPP